MASRAGSLRPARALVPFVALVVLCAARRTDGASLRVEYLVEAGALRRAGADTMLGVAVHGDAACTTAMATAEVALRDLALIEDVRTLRVRGLAKRRRAARLLHVLPDVPDARAYWVVVTAARGIVPVGGACQLQPAGTAVLAAQQPPADGSSPGGAVPCLSQTGSDVYFTGCNVHILSGAGATDAPVNGLGNLVVGYNGGPPDARGGSHNIVVGDGHSYASFGGVVAGRGNTISAPSATVIGGSGNVAAADISAVVAGTDNAVLGVGGAVLGGYRNVVGFTVGTGVNASIAGGSENAAYAYNSCVVGGFQNVLGDALDPDVGGNGAILGGYANRITGRVGTVTGGQYNETVGLHAVVGGGSGNVAAGNFSAVCGGEGNRAAGIASAVGGGHLRTVPECVSSPLGVICASDGVHDWRAGGLFQDF